MDLLAHYNYAIQYQPGKNNRAADTLLHKAKLVPENPMEETPATLFPANQFVKTATEVTQLNNQEHIKCILVVLKEAVQSDNQIQQQIQEASTGQTLPNTVVLVDSLPYYQDQVYIPENPALKHQILRLYHNSPITGHLGQSGTLELIRRTYWWKGMTTYIREYIQGCHTCSQNKHQNQKEAGLMQPLPAPDRPWQWTQSDHITRLPASHGYDAIYVVMDHLMKVSHFIPTTTHTSADGLVQPHQHIWKHHRTPRVHNTDRGSTFMADYTQRFFKALSINQRFSTTYHLQTQGQVENNNKWVETYIRMFCNHEQRNWADLLHTAKFTYNNHHHPSIGMSPFKANMGYDMNLMGTGPSQGHDTPLRLALLCRLHKKCKLWLDKAQKQQGQHYNKRHQDTPALMPGSQVWLSSRDISTNHPSLKLDAL